MVNNAGYTQTGAVEENSVADARAQFDTNVLGALRVTNAAACSEPTLTAPAGPNRL